MAPLIHPETPRLAVPCRCALGEEPVWEARTGTVMWVDIEDPALWRHRPEGDETSRLALDEKIGFALPTPDPDIVVAGFRSGLARLRLSDGTRTPVLAPEPDQPGNRLNSGHVGPDGVLYFGTMDDAEERPSGTFYRYDGQHLDAFGGRSAVTNGPVTSADGRILYTVDTAAGSVRASDLTDGRPGPVRELIRFEAGWGKPDGLTVDAEEHLWVCHYGGSRITRFRPDGSIERIVPMPTALVTQCAFGGPDLTTLYVTTCLRGRDPTLEPMAGHLFVLDVGLRGLPVQNCVV